MVIGVCAENIIKFHRFHVVNLGLEVKIHTSEARRHIANPRLVNGLLAWGFRSERRDALTLGRRLEGSRRKGSRCFPFLADFRIIYRRIIITSIDDSMGIRGRLVVSGTSI